MVAKAGLEVLSEQSTAKHMHMESMHMHIIMFMMAANFITKGFLS